MKATANEGDHAITINGKVIEMPACVREGLVFKDIFIVVLDVKYSMRNVLAFDETGRQVWAIEDPDFEVPGSGFALIDSDGTRLVALCRGTHFYIDPKNGRIYDVNRGK